MLSTTKVTACAGPAPISSAAHAARPQVASRADVKPGSFYVDEKADRLYVGSDPSAAKVEASTLSVPLTKALGIAAITMACSMLLPLRPLDGAAVGRAGVLVGGAAVAGAILVVLGLV